MKRSGGPLLHALTPEPHLVVDDLLEPSSAIPKDWTWDTNGTFRFTSPVRTEAFPNNTVHGCFFPAGDRWTARPTAILLHGWNADLEYRHLFPYLAQHFKRAGMNTAVIELPYHMQRRPRSGPVRDFICSDAERMLEAARQAIADTRALCRWLERQGVPGVGLWGFSLGAWLAGLTARAEERLRFVVLATPIARVDRVIEELPFCEQVRESLKSRKVDLGRLNLEWQQPRTETKRILLIEGRHDQFVPAETVEELWRAWNRQEIWRLAHGHISFLMSIRALKRTVGWIQERA